MKTTKENEPLSLGHMPAGRWVFDEKVTNVFSDMLRRSIPEYETMRSAAFAMGARFVKADTCIVDLGCSRGDALEPFVAQYKDNNRYLGVEISQPMLAAVRERFREEIARGTVTISEMDLRERYPTVKASLTLSILSLQFIPIEHRQRLLRDAFESTLPGGAFLLVEKILGSSARVNEAMVSVYHARKKDAGYTTEEVERKRLALEGVLMPVTARWNEDLLRGAGFREVDCFWRWMNFAGWIATT